MGTQRLLLFVGILAISFVNVGFVKVMSINVEEIPKTDRWAATSSNELKKTVKTTKDPLAKAGIYDSLEDWENCVLNARKVSAASSVRDWALLLELDCAKQMADEDVKAKGPKATGALLAEAIKRVESFSFDTYSKTLQERKTQNLLAARMSLCKWYDKHSRWKDLSTEIRRLFKLENFLSKNDRAQLYYYAGESLVADRQWVDAYWQFQRARELNPETNQIDARVRGVLPMIPASVREQVEERMKKNIEAASSPAPMPSNDEIELFNQAEGYRARNDPAGAVEAYSKLLKKFPGGIKAKTSQDKIFELLISEIEKSRGPNGVSVNKKRIEGVMLDLDSERQSEWGKSLFDMQAYAEAAPLLKKAAEQISGSLKASKTYYLAARAYQIINGNAEAKDIYQLIVKNYPQATEVVDAAIQWALINFNENDPSEAITHLEIARARKLTSQQDLISLFWLYQSYKLKNATSGVADTSAELMRRFGLTYYGLIAHQDQKKQLPQYEKAKNKNAKVYFSQVEVHALERARALLGIGFLTQAAEELAPFGSRPLSNGEEQYLANFYAQALRYPKAFSLLTAVVDESPEKRNDFVVQQLFPKEYFDLASDDKRRSDVDPLLLLSIMKQESAFDKLAVSRSGAVGLMQMIPPTAQEVKSEINSNAEVPKDLFEPATNIKFCAHYFSRMLKKYGGSVPLALAAYNAGPTRITQFVNARGGTLRDTWVDELPWAETSFYVKSILKNYVMYRMLYSGLTQLPTPPWTR